MPAPLQWNSVRPDCLLISLPAVPGCGRSVRVHRSVNDHFGRRGVRLISWTGGGVDAHYLRRSPSPRSPAGEIRWSALRNRYARLPGPRSPRVFAGEGTWTIAGLLVAFMSAS